MPELPFVGRAAELQLLEDRFDAVCSGSSHLLLVSAPAGTGKTALLRHFRSLLSGRAHTGQGRGWDNRGATSLHALREVLQSLGEPADFDATVRHFLADPSLDASSPISLNRLFPNLVSFFAARSQDRPLCLFLDDLQWVDEATFEWLDYAFRRLAKAPILWIGAYRREEADALASLLRKRSEWQATGRFAERALGPLARAEVTELTRRCLPDSAEEIAAEIWERSRGLALLAVEEIRARWDGHAGCRVGETLIASRLERLCAAERELLSVAAVAGERFSAEAVAAALGQDALEVVRQLEVLRVSQGLLEEDGAGYRFAHSRYREALLAQMSQALRRHWHARLVDRAVSLPSSERTYHLVHSGDIDRGIQALVEEGDHTRRQSNWRDALRYYMEALWLVQSRPDQNDRLYLTLFQRIGDLHLMCSGQHEIARSYYQAASCWVVTPRDRILMLCRLAHTRHGGSPLRRQLLEEAEDLLSRIDDRSLRDWVHFLRANDSPFLTARDREQLFSLVRRLHPTPDLPEAWFSWAATSLFTQIAEQGDRGELKRQVERVKDLWPEAVHDFTFHHALAVAYRIAGLDTEACRYHLRQTHHLCARVGYLPGLLGSFGEELDLEMQKGDYRKVRRMVAEFMEEYPQPGPLWMLYYSACLTWRYDRSPEGLEWAIRYIKGKEAFFLEYPSDGGHLNALLKHWGIIERIFKELGHREEFEQRIDVLRDRLEAAGYRTDASWYLSSPVDLPDLSAIEGLEAWRRPAGNNVRVEDESVLFHLVSAANSPIESRPKIGYLLSGDFALQSTVHAGSEVLESMLSGRQELEEGIPEQLIGSGGLYAMRDKHCFLILSAHADEPGEVAFGIHGEGRKPLGRGLLHDDPLPLRLERKGTTFCAYAGDKDGTWRQVGSIDLPDWSEVEIGMFGAPGPGRLSSTSAVSILTRFRDIRLRCSSARPAAPPVAAALYRLPEPIYFPGLPDTVAASRSMRDILARVQHTAHATLPVLIRGETGTGKERIACAVHLLSDRACGPFISLNCAALPAELLENELFGHVRGAFTGAYENRGGLLEAAHGGILFLDEIGETSPQFQAHLLRALEEGVVRRIGDSRMRPAHVRFVAATNQDLEQALDENRFRRDFFFRLKGVDIHLPPLRERREDIPHLVAHALRQRSRHRQVALPSITRRAVEQLMDYAWPGNIRELFHVVEEAADRAGDEPISDTHLSIYVPSFRRSSAEKELNEHQRLTAALQATRGNVSEAARRLGVSRNTIYRRMRKLGIK